jgi:NTE family protein
VAAGLASGLDVETMVRESVVGSSHAIKFTIPRYSFLSNRGLQQWLHRLVGDAQIEELPIPLTIIAVDVLERRKVIMDRGLVWKAVLASVAIPGIYPPVWIGDHCLVDGALLDPVPAGAARSLGADVVLGLGLTVAPIRPPVAIAATEDQRGRRPPHVVNLLNRAFDVMGTEIEARVVEGADVMITPEVEHMSLRDFRRAQIFLAAGESAVQRAWPQVSTLLPWLREVDPSVDHPDNRCSI